MLLAVSRAPIAAILGLALLGSGALVLQRARGMGRRSTPRPDSDVSWPDVAKAGDQADAERRTLVSRFSRHSGDPPPVFADELQGLELPPSAASITLQTVRDTVASGEAALDEDDQPRLPLTFAPRATAIPRRAGNDVGRESVPGSPRGTEPDADDQSAEARPALSWNASDAKSAEGSHPQGMSYASLVGEYLKRLRSPRDRGGDS
jgi:hypothetical protein